MRLSEAIRLGSLTIPEPRGNDLSACAVTMACHSVGIEAGYAELEAYWPWLLSIPAHSLKCPACSELLPISPVAQSSVVWSPFDDHVIDDGAMTIEQLADWIASIEPQEETLPVQGRHEETLEALASARGEK